MVLVAGLAVIAGSALWLILTGNTGVRYSADHDGTIPMWFRWIPALAGILLVWLVPPGVRRPGDRGPADPGPGDPGPGDPGPGAPPGRALRLEVVVLLCAAALFAATLWLAGGGEPAHTLLKLPLLLGVPVVMFWVLRRRGVAGLPGGVQTGSWRSYGPAIPVVAWLVLSYAGPLAVPPSDYARTVDAITLVATVVVVFLLNSLLEEVFYRRWLQTRAELLLGAWPAIVLASLLWAVWHAGIQGTGAPSVDLASALVNQGVLGLFLGYLWCRYRLMWPILVVHSAVNAAPIMVSLL